MNYKILLIILLICIIILSQRCKINNGDLNSLIKPQPVSSITLKLDDQTPNFSNISFQYIESELDKSILLFNSIFNRLYVYNPKTGEVLNSFDFFKEGNRGIGSPENFKYINKDTILFTQRNANLISISNLENTNVSIKKFNISNKERGLIPLVSDRSGIIFWNSQIFLTNPMVYIPGQSMAPEVFKNHDNSNFIFEYSLKEELKLNNSAKFPIKYKESVYTDYFNNISQFFYSNKIIYSFPLSDSLFIYTPLEKQVKRVIAGFSKEKIYPILKISESKGNVPNLSSNEQLDYFLNSFNYDKILYDQYKNLYYRFIEFPKPKSNLNIPVRIKPIGILVFDSNFKKIGEYDLGFGKYVILHSFVSPQGLNIVNYEKVLSEESSITFDIFDFSLPEQL